MLKRNLELISSVSYPCYLDFLLDDWYDVRVIIYTKVAAIREEIGVGTAGIVKLDQGVYLIVVDTIELDQRNVESALENLSRMNGFFYRLKDRTSDFILV